MSGLVPQDAHQPVAIAAFDLTHEPPFEAYQSPVRQVEGNGDPGDAVRGKPLLRQPTMRSETDAARRQFPVQPVDRLFEIRSLDGELQITESERQ